MKGQILIIDDNPVDIKIASLALEKSGFACFGFVDYKKAFDWIDSNQPQMIFLDLQMPEASGFDLIPLIRKTANLATVPIIIISGRNQTEDVKQAIKAGANDYVVKPLDPLVLQEKVTRLNSNSEGEFHCIDLNQVGIQTAVIAKTVQLIALSEFGMTVSTDCDLKIGETLEISQVAPEIFGKDRIVVRCLNIKTSTDGHREAQVTFVGIPESQRQVIRQACRKFWIQSKAGAV